MWTIPLSAPDYDDGEARAVAAVIASRWLSLGPETAAFEADFTAAHDGQREDRAACGSRSPVPGDAHAPHDETSQHAVAVSSGSAALYLALRAVGVGPGDEVLLPSLTFVATAQAVLQCGARPVFADVQSAERPLLDPDDVARRITGRTRALIPVHYGGWLCQMSALRTLADLHGLALIADAAHAAGTADVGDLADASCFSFYANKNLATGEGGLVLTRDEAMAETCRMLRSHGRRTSSHDKARGDLTRDDVTLPGINARISEIASALGRVQLRKLTEGNTRRRELRRHYASRLGDAVSIPFAGDEEASACHLMVVILPEGCQRKRVRESLARRGIQTSVHYPPVHGLSLFAGEDHGALPITEALAPRLLTLPLHPRLGEEQVEQVSEALLAALATAARPPEPHP